MLQHVQTEGISWVLANIGTALETLSIRLDIPISESRMKVLCEDVIECYKWDAIEDLKLALKKAGQGRYDWGMLKRGTITMEHIKYWMGYHLEEKAIERENILKNRKADEHHIPQVNYEAYKARMVEEADKKAEQEAKRAELVRQQAETILKSRK